MVKRHASLKKAPTAPRRFKSAYIFFSSYKHKQLRRELDPKISTPEVAKMVASAWKTLSDDERGYWEQMASRDKARFEIERASYLGPWKVHKGYRPRDPTAPTRPMSAFLAYAKGQRPALQTAHPELSVTELSCVIAGMWRQASDAEREPLFQEYATLMQTYKVEMVAYKQREAAEKKRRESIALKQAKHLGLWSVAAAPMSLNTVLFGATDEANSANGSSTLRHERSNSDGWEEVADFLSQENSGVPGSKVDNDSVDGFRFDEETNSESQQQQHEQRTPVVGPNRASTDDLDL